MKEKKVIEKLNLLKSVQPDTDTLQMIRKRIPPQRSQDKSLVFPKWLTLSSLVPLVAITGVLIILLVIAGFFPQNHYEKAKIALANANAQFAVFKKSPVDDQEINSLSHSLTLANTEMSGLKLRGEKGKYTMQDCLSLYSVYHNSLETMKKTVSSQNNSSQKEKQLLSEIKQFDEQSEKRLHTYNK